ncbi:MAG: hypothetical protein JXQ27_12620 [Acidobacteria bacterium]|nr:hypothetical protein [Acidobacteriota bacterium]
MPKRLLPVLILFLALLAGRAAAETEKVPGKLVFMVQYDMPTADAFNFDEGFPWLMKELPPECMVELTYFFKDMIRQAKSATAGEFPWPVVNPSFLPANPSTVPYKNLLKFLEENSIQDTTVMFVSNGVSEELRRTLDSGAFGRGQTAFNPQRYSPLSKIIDYCKSNNVRLLGFYIPAQRGATRVTQNDIFLEAFRYVVNQSGGKAFYNFSSFEGVFKAVLKEETLCAGE